MRHRLALAVLAAVLTACGASGTSADADLGPLAEHADRVGQLVDAGQGCEAVDALDQLRELAGPDVPADVRDAVTSFVDSAAQSVTCDPAPGSPEPADEDDEGRPEKPAKPGKPDDDDKPGRGEGRDRGDEDDDEDSDDGEDDDD